LGCAEVNTATSNFVDELRSDSERATIADAVSHALAMVDQEADGNPHAAALMEAVYWIIGNSDRTVEARLRGIMKLLSLKGRVEIADLRTWLGWNN
jgi:hypothetical protein